LVAIQGVGSIKLCINGHTVSIPEVCYVPNLAENIYSLFCHIQCPDHGLYSSFDEGLHILFPHFRTREILAVNDIYVDATPCVSTSVQSETDTRPISTMSICRNMSRFQDEVQLESNKVDNLLANLRRYYNNINSKRQLNLEVPAGFRKNNNFQRLIRDAHLYNLSHNAPDLFSDNHIEEHILSDDIPQVTTPHIDDSESTSAFHADNDSNTRVLILIPSILVNSE